MNSLSVSFTGRASQFCGSAPKAKKALPAQRLQTNLDTDGKMPGQAVISDPITSIMENMQALGLNIVDAEYSSAKRAYSDARARLNGLTGPQQTLFNNHQAICKNQGILAEDLAFFSQQDSNVQSANEEVQKQFGLVAKSSVGLIPPLQKAASLYNAAKKNQELIERKWAVMKSQKLDAKLDAAALDALGKAFDSVTARADELTGKYLHDARLQKKAAEDQCILSKVLGRKEPSPARIEKAINRLSETLQAQAEDYQACQKGLEALVVQQTSAVETQATVLDKMVWILEPDKVKVRQAEQAARKEKKLNVQA